MHPPIIQTLVKVGLNGTEFDQSWSNKVKIEGKTRKNLVKVWDIRWSKLFKVMKWFALLTILKLQLRLR
jgi:hypothetical protein